MSVLPAPLVPLARSAGGPEAHARGQLARVSAVHPSREFLQSVAESCADAIITADAAGRVTWVSASAKAMFGFEPEELVGWPVAELFAGGRDEVRAIVRHVAREGTLRNYLTTFPGQAGCRVPVSASLAFLRDPTGTVTGMVAILTDITASRCFDVGRGTIVAPTMEIPAG
jgi:PAS domain S-box-containing protein